LIAHYCVCSEIRWRCTGHYSRWSGDFEKTTQNHRGLALEQEQFVASNAVSIAQAYFDRDTTWFRAIYAAKTPVGFVMLSEVPAQAEYFLWRFMLDTRYQRQGFGQRAIKLILEHVRLQPNATELSVSCVLGDGSPRAFYERAGFVSTGEMDGEELILKYALM
jgi:diamine N-acetyltransferase